VGGGGAGREGGWGWHINRAGGVNEAVGEESGRSVGVLLEEKG